MTWLTEAPLRMETGIVLLIYPGARHGWDLNLNPEAIESLCVLLNNAFSGYVLMRQRTHQRAQK